MIKLSSFANYIIKYRKQRLFIMFNDNPWKNKSANYNQIHVLYFFEICYDNYQSSS